MTVATVTRTRAAVDVSSLDTLSRALAPAPLAGRDDVVSALGLLPAPRVALPYERHQVVTSTVAHWHGPLRVERGEVTWAGYGASDGLAFYLRATVGGMRLAVRSHASQYRREARADGQLVDASGVTDEERAYAEDVARSALVDQVDDVDAPRVRGNITEWSRRSRQRMVEVLSSLDYGPLSVEGRTLGMVTLTYPGDWVACAPTGKSAKKHLDNFRRAWSRAYGKLLGAWKLEFQRRGAPHFHLLAPVPVLAPVGWHRPDCGRCFTVHPFTDWLSWTWAGVVGADRESGEFRRHVLAGTAVDFSAAMTDPRRIGVYFLKHGTKTLDDKEYQHVVPAPWRAEGAGPGRFWGVWGLTRTDVLVPVDVRQYVTARRLLRRVVRARARSAAYRRAMRVAERQGLTGAAAVRFAASAPSVVPRTLGARGGLSGGWVLVNDGVKLAQAIAYWLALTEGHDRLCRCGDLHCRPL